MENNELYHFGVKGMKWGVRKSDEQKAIKNISVITVLQHQDLILYERLGMIVY